MLKFIVLFFITTLSLSVKAQFIQQAHDKYSHADTLRGMLRPERTCIDVHFYKLDIEVLIKDKAIIGSVEMDYEIKSDTRKIQIDLYSNMFIDSILCQGKKCNYTRDFNAVFVDIPFQTKASFGSLVTYYHGKPTVAKNAPWDGGFVWSKDKSKRPWIGVACEGAGASLWWPCKDHPSDEPDSVSISVTTPDSLSCIANGNMTGKQSLDNHRTKYTWKVNYSINLYNVTLYIGDYYLIDDTVYNDFKDNKLNIKYWILNKKFTVAKLHFKHIPEMLHGYEHYFGPFPFFKDGYSLVESPYLGMEHQSAIAYGNNYMRGYLGGRMPADQNFDYIIIHESAHEYWGNSVSADDHADLWIHESFATYTEALYVEWIQNYQKAVEYLYYYKPNIRNKTPMVGPRNVNYNNWKDSDIYYKGAWMLHSLRNTINKDSLWFNYLKDLCLHFAGKVTNTTEIVQFTNSYLKKDYTSFFQEFLMNSNLPVFEYNIKKKGKGLILSYRWNSSVQGFNMPLRVGNDEKWWRIYPSNKLQTIKLKEIAPDKFRMDEYSFLFDSLKVENL